MSQYRLGFLAEIDCASYTFSTVIHSELSPAIGAYKHTGNDRSKHKLHKSAIARLLSHGWYRQNCGASCSQPGRHVFHRYFLLRLAWVNALGPSASAGFLVRTGAGNAHGAK